MKQRRTDTRPTRLRPDDLLPNTRVSQEYIHSLVGCCKGEDSLVEAREREHSQDDQAKNQKLMLPAEN
jgi:hypothetical protein